jgi:hypothetical protein
MDELNRADQLRLVKFLCSFAWADLEVRSEERAFVKRVVQQLQLDDEDQAKIQGWLAVPPSPESVDPMLVPRTHRKVFLDSIEGVIVSDGVITPEERENFDLLKTLLA